MTLKLKYPDTGIFIKTTSDGYANTKITSEQESVPIIFVQNTGFERNNAQDSVKSDAVCYPDFTNGFVIENVNRLEGMYLIVQLFNSTENQSWYKIIDVTVNRDHLLNNKIDNIELRLKKTRPVSGVNLS